MQRVMRSPGIVHRQQLLYGDLLYKPLCLQYDVLKRISAEGAMKHSYFDALGPAVKLLPDSK